MAAKFLFLPMLLIWFPSIASVLLISLGMMYSDILDCPNYLVNSRQIGIYELKEQTEKQVV